MTTTWCVIGDVQSILSSAGATACLDDDETGTLSAGESAYGTDMIETAAVEMNASIERQYILADLAGNGWCKRANAILAAYFTSGRRSNPIPQTLADWAATVREYLALVADGRRQIPEATSSLDHGPAVSTFRPELWKRQPIRVDTQLSTGTPPADGIKRLPSNASGIY